MSLFKRRQYWDGSYYTLWDYAMIAWWKVTGWDGGFFVKTLFRKIKWFIQRGKRGYSDRDLWNLDTHLVNIMLPAIKRLKKEKVGYPYDFTLKAWDKELDKMIIGLKAYNELYSDNFPYKNYNKNLKIANKGLESIFKYFQHLND